MSELLAILNGALFGKYFQVYGSGHGLVSSGIGMQVIATVVLRGEFGRVGGVS